MKIAPYVKGRLYDEYIEFIVKEGISKAVTKKNDDFFLFNFGDTGTGKSSLTLHIYELYDPKGASNEYIGINRSSHAIALQKAKNKKDKRFCTHDEADVSRREHSDQYNKDLLRTYNQIRGLNIFHIWNNPSADMLDRPFIKERIKGFIYIFTKDVEPKPRLYYYFTKKALLRLYDKTKGDLSFDTMDKHAPQFATWRGWFHSYQGKLWSAYSKKKDEKMDVAVETFANRYGNEDFVSMAMAGKIIGMSPTTVRKYGNILSHNKVLKEGIDYVEDGVGRYRFSSLGIQKLKDYGRKNIEKK